MKKHLILCLLLAVLATSADAQSYYSLRRDRSLIFLAGLNTATYYGDLKDDTDFLDMRPSLSLGLMTGVTRRLYVRSEFSWINLSGKDLPEAGTGRMGRNLSFYSNNYELNVSGVFYLTPYKGRFYQRPNFNIYGVLGVGALYFNPKTRLDGREYALQPLQTEGVHYSRVALVIPYGLGARLKLTPFINVAGEAVWRKTFTDYIDDVSTVHIDNASITNPITKRLTDRRPEAHLPVAKAGTQRGDPSDKDGYMLMSLKLEIYLPIQLGGTHEFYGRKRRAAYR